MSLIIVTGFALAVEVGKEILHRLAPYWPLVWSQLKFWAVVSLVLYVAYRCRHVIAVEIERWWQRREVERRTEEAKAEILDIHRDTALQMERVRRQAGR